ncbi:hypothetical protein C1I59_18875 [Paenibacillus polymyxa]|nr:hypothetical protein C1I59_18875 [Paenibacillus polymyxa]
MSRRNCKVRGVLKDAFFYDVGFKNIKLTKKVGIIYNKQRKSWDLSIKVSIWRIIQLRFRYFPFIFDEWRIFMI